MPHGVIFDGALVVIVEQIERAQAAADRAGAVEMHGDEAALADDPAGIGVHRDLVALALHGDLVAARRLVDVLGDGALEGEVDHVEEDAHIDGEGLGLGGTGQGRRSGPGKEQKGQGGRQKRSARKAERHG